MDATDPAVSIDEEAFAAACRAQPEKTVLGEWMDCAWFEKLGLGLVEGRSCLAELCAACGC